MADPSPLAAEVRKLVELVRSVDAPSLIKECFLRELISNAADAIDRRWVADHRLAGGSLSGEDDFIRVIPNLSQGTLTVWDSGIGLTGDDLKLKFDRVSKQGGRQVLQTAGSGAAAVAAMHFGLGFFSCFLVADRVRVITKHAADVHYTLETDGRTFRVQRDLSPPLALHRGTQVILHLTEFGRRFLDLGHLRDVLTTQCDFVTAPILLPAAAICEPRGGELPPAQGPDALVSFYERVNTKPPLWLRSPADIKPEEHAEFYCRHFRQWQAPLAVEHVRREPELAYSGILFMPHHDDLEIGAAEQESTRLYVRHVLIAPEFCPPLLPRFLSFLKAVIWVDEPVSELAKDDFKGLKALAPALTDAALSMLAKLARRDPERFNLAWFAFGWTLRHGLEDRRCRPRVVALLRFFSSKSPDKLISLDDYVDRMAPRQQEIYYVTGPTRTAVLGSPAMKAAGEREVLLAVGPFTEGVMRGLATALPECYPHLRLHSLGKEAASADKGELKRAAREVEEPVSII